MDSAARDPARDRILLRELAARLRAAGCFERCDGHYVLRIALIVPAFAAAFAAMLLTSGGIWLACALAVAFLSVQLGIVSHDAGHGAVHRRRAVNDLWGHIGMTLACGLSFTHWRKNHNRHHRHPQDEVEDPDAQYAFVYSVHERSAREKRGLADVVRPFQHWYFWPLCALYAWSLRWDSVVHSLRDPGRTRVDRWLLAGHYVFWLAIPALLVGPLHAIVSYILVSTGIALYLVAIFAPNHIGMPMVRGDVRRTYLERQIETARDVRVGPIMRVVMGGLEYQIEHHLFPSIGYARLRRARPIVTDFCAEHGFRRWERGFWQAHREVLGQLARMARLSATS